MSFNFQRFSLPGSRSRLTTFPFPHAVSHNASAIGEPMTPAKCRGSKDLSIQKVRFTKLGVTRGMATDPLLELPLFEVFTPLALASCFHDASSLGLPHLAERRTALRDACSAEFQEPEDRLISFESRRPP
jgi:hypothetical protein